MSKYIDAEKLIAKLRWQKHELELSIQSQGDYGQSCQIVVYENILSLIDSLQQEQPETSNNLVDVDAVREDFMTEVYRVLDADPTNDRANAIIDAFDSLPTVSQRSKVDLVAELKHHLATTPKEQLEKEWEELEPWNNIGPTVQEFLYGKQPEVDLEKEIEEHVEGMPMSEFTHESEVDDFWGWARKEFRYFFELGQRIKYQQDRDEFAKLKAREWINGYDEGYAKGLNARKEETK